MLPPRKVSYLAACIVVASCATTTPRPAPAGPPPEDAAAFYPLATGWKWAYRVDRAGDTLLATYAVTERQGDVAVVQAGDERLSYAVLPEGIARQPGDFIVKNPVHAGTRWNIAGGEAKVSAVARTVTVPAGTFPNCATVEEVRRDPERVVRTVYAPGVGPIQIEVQVQSASGGAFETAMRASLVGVTRPGEDPLGAPEGAAGPPVR
jgi:hypothetical protein